MRTKRPYLLRGGILTTVLGISILITSMVTALVLIAAYNRMGAIHERRGLKNLRNAISTVAYARSYGQQLPYDQPVEIDLYGNGIDSVQVLKRRWGLLDLVRVQSGRGGSAAVKSFLMGYQPDAIGASTLYLADLQRPLTVTGNTRVEGSVFLPKAGVRSATIDRTWYKGQQLIYGDIRQSTAQLPELKEQIWQVTDSLRSRQNDSDSIQVFAPGTNYYHSFLENTPLYLHSAGDVLLRNSLDGMIELEVQGDVTIHANAELSGVVIYAKSAKIQSGFQGNLQLICSDNITVEESVRLQYPSTLVTASQKQNEQYIDIRSGTEIHGFLLIVNQTPVHELENSLILHESASFTGSGYVRGKTMLMGKYTGNLITHYFKYQGKRALYENHLMNTLLTGGEDQVKPIFWCATDKTKIVSWLY